MTDPKDITAYSHANQNARVGGTTGNPVRENREWMSYVEFLTAPGNRAVDRAHCRGGGRAVRMHRAGLHFIRPDYNGSTRYDDVYIGIDGRIDRLG